MAAADKPLVWLRGEVKTPPFSAAARLEAARCSGACGGSGRASSLILDRDDSGHHDAPKRLAAPKLLARMVVVPAWSASLYARRD